MFEICLLASGELGSPELFLKIILNLYDGHFFEGIYILLKNKIIMTMTPTIMKIKKMERMRLKSPSL